MFWPKQSPWWPIKYKTCADLYLTLASGHETYNSSQCSVTNAGWIHRLHIKNYGRNCREVLSLKHASSTITRNWIRIHKVPVQCCPNSDAGPMTPRIAAPVETIKRRSERSFKDSQRLGCLPAPNYSKRLVQVTAKDEVYHWRGWHWWCVSWHHTLAGWAIVLLRSMFDFLEPRGRKHNEFPCGWYSCQAPVGGGGRSHISGLRKNERSRFS